MKGGVHTKVCATLGSLGQKRKTQKTNGSPGSAINLMF